MNNRHTPSFLVSILVHLFLLVLIFGAYKSVMVLNKSKKKEQKICIKLGCIAQGHRSHEVVKPKKKVEPTEKKKVIAKEKPIQKQKPIKKQKTPEKKVLKSPKLTKPKILKQPTARPKKQIQKKELISHTLPSKTIQKPQKKPPKKTEPAINAQSDSEVAPSLMQKQQLEPQKQPSQNSEEVYIDHNLQKIVKLLSDNLYYPRSARRRGIQGVVEVRFTLDENAEVSDVNVIASQSDILSRAAIQTIEDLSGEFPKPQKKLQISVPIEYKLR
jgi:protein TonB